MARLSNVEKRQLVAATKRRSAKPAPLAQPMSALAYLEFATFAAKFGRAKKQVRFVGDEWKL